MQKRPGYPVDSVDSALRLLLLLRRDGSVRVTAAAAHLGVAPSTAHRLLAQLRFRNFVVQDRQRVYHPGPALEAVARSAASPDLASVAHGHLAELTRITGETTHLLALEGNGTRFLDCVEGDQTVRVGRRIGLLLPAHTTSGGKALLAELPVGALRKLYPHGLPPARTAALSDLAALRRDLAATRRRGYAINIDESETGVSAVGRTVHDGAGRAVAALAVALPSMRSSRQLLTHLARQLHEAVAGLDADL